MQETRIAINRAAPLIHQAGELHEEIQSQLSKHREIVGSLMDKARQAGQALESAALALKASGLTISFEEVLRAHAPNIEPKQCDKYRRFARGDVTDPRQMGLLGFEVKQIEDTDAHEARAKAEAWERACGWASRLLDLTRTKPVDNWPESQRTELAVKLEPIAKALWPGKF